MAETKLNALELKRLTVTLIGMEVSRAWKGMGSTIFLELGELTERVSRRGKSSLFGEAHISIDWDWRVEQDGIVRFGSSLHGSEIERGLRTLCGAKVLSVSIVGQIPEIVVEFSTGHTLRSMVMANGWPEWGIKLRDGRYVGPGHGHITIGTGDEPYRQTDAEAAAFAAEEAAEKRWKKPVIEPVAGRCEDCQSYVSLNGNWVFSYYGICMSPESPLDGRVVHDDSGCPHYTRKLES